MSQGLPFLGCFAGSSSPSAARSAQRRSPPCPAQPASQSSVAMRRRWRPQRPCREASAMRSAVSTSSSGRPRRTVRRVKRRCPTTQQTTLRDPDHRLRPPTRTIDLDRRPHGPDAPMAAGGAQTFPKAALRRRLVSSLQSDAALRSPSFPSSSVSRPRSVLRPPNPLCPRPQDVAHHHASPARRFGPLNHRLRPCDASTSTCQSLATISSGSGFVQAHPRPPESSKRPSPANHSSAWTKEA